MPENSNGTNFVGNEVPNREVDNLTAVENEYYEKMLKITVEMAKQSELVLKASENALKAFEESSKEQKKLQEELNDEQLKNIIEQRKLNAQNQKIRELEYKNMGESEKSLEDLLDYAKNGFGLPAVIKEEYEKLNKNANQNANNSTNGNSNNDYLRQKALSGLTQQGLVNYGTAKGIDVVALQQQIVRNSTEASEKNKSIKVQQLADAKAYNPNKDNTEQNTKRLAQLEREQALKKFNFETELESAKHDAELENIEQEHKSQIAHAMNLEKLQKTGFKDIFRDANKGSANVIETLKKSFDGYHKHMMDKWDAVGGAKGSIAKNVSSALTSIVSTAIDFGTKLLTEGISEIQNSYASTGMNIGNAIYADRDEIKAMYGDFADELAEDGWDKATSATKVADQAYTLTTMGITNNDELKTMAQAMTEANLMTGGQLNFNTDEQIKDYHNQYLQLLEQNENDVEKTNEDFKQVIMTQASYWVNTTETYGNAIGLVNGKFTEMADQASQLSQRIHNADPTIDTDGIRNQLMSAYTAVAGAVGDIAPDLVAASQNAISSLTDTGVSGDVLNILGGTTVADELKDTIANKDFGKAYAQILQGAMELQQSGDMTGTEALANNLGINGNELNAIATRYSDENGNFDASAFENAIMTGYNQNMQGTGTSEFQDAEQSRQTNTGFTVEEGLKNATLNDAAMDIWGAIPTSLADGDKMIITAINTGADLVKGAITSGIDLIIDQFVKGNVVNGVSNLLGGAGRGILGSVGYTGVGTLSGAFGGVGAFPPLAIATIAGLLVKGVAEYGIYKMDVDGGEEESLELKKKELESLSALTDQLGESTELLKDRADKLIEESEGPLSDERINEVLKDEGYTDNDIKALKASGEAESTAQAFIHSQGVNSNNVADSDKKEDYLTKIEDNYGEVRSSSAESKKHSRDGINTTISNKDYTVTDENGNTYQISNLSSEFFKQAFGDDYDNSTLEKARTAITSYTDDDGNISTKQWEQLQTDIQKGKYSPSVNAAISSWVLS